MLIFNNGNWQDFAHFLAQETSEKFFILTDRHVAPLYLDALSAQFTKCGLRYSSKIIEPGESSKNLEQLCAIYSWLVSENAQRKSYILNLGGGVISDLGGLAAATYMRGIPYINIPTTLIGQIDAAIGGKTAVNFAGIKNIIGSFYEPTMVIVNPSLMGTLPVEEWANGYGEVLKYSVLLGDPQLLESMHNESGLIQSTIERCLEFKRIVSLEDPFDRARRRTLNLGHTLGHALEAIYQLPHGMAVAYGIAGAAYLAWKMGKAHEAFYRAIQDQISNIPHIAPLPSEIDIEAVFAHIHSDKKRQSQREMVWIIPRDWGDVAVESISNDQWQTILAQFYKRKKDNNEASINY